MSHPPLSEQWLVLCHRIGVEGIAEWQSLSKAYTTAGLAYHNLDHIRDCLEKFESRKDEVSNPIAVELAIWYHDVVYDPKASDNEEQSALLASEFLKNTPYHEVVSDLVIATKHSQPGATSDESFLCDIDLSILGSPPAHYQKYSAAIHSEYSWVPEADYRTGRTKILEGFLNRKSIFALKTSQDLYESQARQNLSNEVLQLQAEN